jgi:hypothetical protein
MNDCAAPKIAEVNVLTLRTMRWLESMAAAGRFDYLTRAADGSIALWRRNAAGAAVYVGGIAVPPPRQAAPAGPEVNRP